MLHRIFFERKGCQPTKQEHFPKEGDKKNFTDEEQTLLDLLDVYPQTIDNLINKTNISAAKMQQLLLQLEIKGAVEPLLGHRYSLNRH